MGEPRQSSKSLEPLTLSAQEKRFLKRLARLDCSESRLSERSRIILRCADGVPNRQVALQLNVSEHTVGKWRRRFLHNRTEGLVDRPRTGRPRWISDEVIAKIVTLTLETLPSVGTKWSIRSMAAATGHSHTTIRRIWKATGLHPHATNQADGG